MPPPIIVAASSTGAGSSIDPPHAAKGKGKAAKAAPKRPPRARRAGADRVSAYDLGQALDKMWTVMLGVGLSVFQPGWDPSDKLWPYRDMPLTTLVLCQDEGSVGHALTWFFQYGLGMRVGLFSFCPHPAAPHVSEAFGLRDVVLRALVCAPATGDLASLHGTA